ncbi:hypothetical protein CYJ76_01150 [Kytococcus schroeteri]|uniref:Uncharacterized protein n=1 Tax=Kytococcus schroeteri TaxID=138300 RepID=A0A2I1PCZ8_9MICO|nr:hypothetical protein CYJ76_01150 [Kytococcus schroeteri]
MVLEVRTQLARRSQSMTWVTHLTVVHDAATAGTAVDRATAGADHAAPWTRVRREVAVCVRLDM